MYKIALIGRPNVGKSTLFNRLIRSNRAITHDRAGITRDRMEGTVKRNEHIFALIDTGGITLNPNSDEVEEGPLELQGFETALLHQAEIAITESEVVALVVDAKEGLHPFDQSLAYFLRRNSKPVLLVVNKIDSLEQEDLLCSDFHCLGFDLLPVSAEHGYNILNLEDKLISKLPCLPQEEQNNETQKKSLKLAMLGRPNVGKSSLVNAIIGQDRMIVSDIAGTTRDSVDISFKKNKELYTFVDTAGIRRKSKITDSVERFSVNSSIKSSTKADITLLTFDTTEGLTVQDKKLLSLLYERKTPFMILINKIDLIEKGELKKVQKEFKECLNYCAYVPLLFVSSKTKHNLSKILITAKIIHQECSIRIPTAQLNRAMEEVLMRNQPPVVKQARPKFFYLTQAESDPPTFVFFVSDADRVKDSYVKYLEKSLRKIFSITHAPVRVHLRSSHKKEKNK